MGGALTAMLGRSASSGGDPYWANVVLLAGWESGYIDESPVGRTLTFVPASASGRSNTASKFGSYALFSTNGGYVSAPDSADWDFGTSPFTIEMWARSNGTSVQTFLVGQYDTTNNQRSWGIAYTGSTSSWQFFLTATPTVNAVKITATATLTTSVWYHIALDFDGTKYRLYVDGVMVGSATGVVTPANSTAQLRIAHAGAGVTGFVGYLDEVRITKGVARYASDSGFSVPTAAYPRS